MGSPTRLDKEDHRLTWGPNGCAVADESSFVRFLNYAQTEDDKGSRFRRQQYLYKIQAYVIAALAVQNASGSRYSNFLKENIFKPLGIQDSITDNCELEACLNKAHGYAKLEDSSILKIDTAGWTENENSPTSRLSESVAP
ncbi:hypothetical protein F4678DRAFT_196973 [Xylaria arbuscula]|nr:hypothetical protein F4678DRAFT_196973 [Xylaria arbuscula]